ncbi:unnamed protein product, partial [Vitis vinifera]
MSHLSSRTWTRISEVYLSLLKS